MTRRFLLVTIVLSSAVTFLLGLAVAGWVAPAPGSTPPAITRPASVMPRVVDRPALPVAIPGGVDFADVTAQVDDAVVNIDTAVAEPELETTPRFRRRRPSPAPGDGDSEVPEPGSGSGFIIDPAGYIFTNHHVIDGAQRITVTLADGRVFRGEVIGTDPAIDVALLKIAAEQPLPVAPFGDSSRLRPGEWVCAIGNPLGYVHSVTVGVVSFIGRKLFDASLDDYIQTDAAINFGNSGGPLINARGEVVGINAAISSQGNSIGFAIPINQAVAVLPQLKARGFVSRGFIGVSLVDVSPDLQKSLKLPTTVGALVLDVSSPSPAQRAGLRVYDLILSVDDQDVGSNDQLIREIARREPGGVVRLHLLRDGRERDVQVKLTERPSTEEADDGAAPSDLSRPAGGQPSTRGRPTIGLAVRDLDDNFIRRFALPADVRGVLVTRVDPAGAASGADIRRGFLILEINRQPVRTAAEFERILAGTRPGDALALYVYNPIPGQRDLIAVTVDESR
jgi:serine protease Do